MYCHLFWLLAGEWKLVVTSELTYLVWLILMLEYKVSLEKMEVDLKNLLLDRKWQVIYVCNLHQYCVRLNINCH